MTTTFKAGDKVEWESSQGTVTGKVKKKLTAPQLCAHNSQSITLHICRNSHWGGSITKTADLHQS